MDELPMERLAQAVKEKWLELGLRLIPGATEAEFNAFEQQHGAILPPDVRCFLQTVGGLEECAWDNEMVDWYSLDRWERLATTYAIPEEIEHKNDYFVFADYSLRAILYAVRLGPTPGTASRVLGHTGGGRIPYWYLADSFTELIEAYLRDSSIVLG